MASRAVRRVWLDGRPARLGYLAQLRRADSARLSLRLMTEGFEMLEQTRRSDELPFDLTSIMADNLPARRLLERGLPGLPRYRPLSTLITLTMPTSGTRRSRTPRSLRVEASGPEGLEQVADCLQRSSRRSRLAPLWTAEDLASPEVTRGLDPGDLLVVRDGSRVRACAAVWDQRSFRQLVVTGYAPWPGRLRGLVNLGLMLARRPQLPAPGNTLSLAFLSHLAVDDDEPGLILTLIDAAREAARRRGIDLLALGLPCSFPGLEPIIRHTRARPLESTLYLVHREAAGAFLDLIGLESAHAEVAVL
jgi:hypothetical protein